MCDIVERMEKVREVCAAANSARAANNIRNRQPLPELKIVGDSLSFIAENPAWAQIIKDECNVKAVRLVSSKIEAVLL